MRQRLRELDTTGIPEGFIIAASFFVSDPQACERAIHDRLSEFRACQEREFFRISPGCALAATTEILSAFLHDSLQRQIDSPSPALDELDETILQLIFHTQCQHVWPEGVAC
jgi:hypothetical protein